MPRLIVPSIGGGTNRSGTLRTATVGVAVGVAIGDGDGDSVSIVDGVGDSCANAVLASAHVATIGNWKLAIGNLRIITPINVREKIVAPFAICEEFFIERARYELVVQLVEPAKVVEHALARILARCASPHQERPIARLREQKLAGELFENAIL